MAKAGVVALGRTPIACTGNACQRLGGSRVVVAGELREVVDLGDGREAWSYTDPNATRLAIVDARGSVKRIPQPRALGDDELERGRCPEPMIAHLAVIGPTLHAFVMECDPDASFRDETYAGSQHDEVVYGSFTSARLEPEQFALASDATPIVAGVRASKLAIARPHRDGTWDVIATAIPTTWVMSLVVAADGAAWTLSIGVGADQVDRATVARDGVPVELPVTRDMPPDLRAFALAVDPRFGVIVLAWSQAGAAWLFAERPIPKPDGTLE